MAQSSRAFEMVVSCTLKFTLPEMAVFFVKKKKRGTGYEKEKIFGITVMYCNACSPA